MVNGNPKWILLCEEKPCVTDEYFVIIDGGGFLRRAVQEINNDGEYELDDRKYPDGCKIVYWLKE